MKLYHNWLKTVKTLSKERQNTFSFARNLPKALLFGLTWSGFSITYQTIESAYPMNRDLSNRFGQNADPQTKPNYLGQLLSLTSIQDQQLTRSIIYFFTVVNWASKSNCPLQLSSRCQSWVAITFENFLMLRHAIFCETLNPTLSLLETITTLKTFIRCSLSERLFHDITIYRSCPMTQIEGLMWILAFEHLLFIAEWKT